MRRKLGIVLGVAVAALVAVSAAALWLHRERTRPLTIPILMYHKIGDQADSVWWVSLRDLENQVRFLADNGYRTILPSDLAANRRWGKPLPRRPVILTFDDGYLNQKEAEPILREHGFRAIIYLITARVADDPENRGEFEGVPLLTWPEIVEMRKRGVFAFGGHGHTHANLAALRDPSEEIVRCFDAILQRLGAPPDSFCYAHGQFRPETLPHVRRAGFTTAFGCDDRIAAIGPETDLLTLPRVSVMGGHHAFSIRRLHEPANPDEVVFLVGKTGPAIDVSPTIVGPDMRRDLASVRIGAEDVEVRASLAGEASAGARYGIELWDRNRVLRLAAFGG